MSIGKPPTLTWLLFSTWFICRSGRLSELYNDLENSQEEMLTGSLAGQGRHGCQLQFTATFSLLGSCHYYISSRKPGNEMAFKIFLNHKILISKPCKQSYFLGECYGLPVEHQTRIERFWVQPSLGKPNDKHFFLLITSSFTQLLLFSGQVQ